MENLPIDKGFAILKWWTSQKPTDKLLVFLVIVIIVLATSLVNVLGTNGTLQKENLNARVECEQRVNISVTWQRNRDDSILANKEVKWEIERQLFYSRAPIVKDRNERIEKALK